MRILPPLPVQQVANHEVQGNPFCEPAKRPIENSKFHLASGSGRPAIRLKSVDSAVGLRPISGAPEQVRPPAIRFEPTEQAPIQSNPLIRSEHHVNPDLVNTGLAEPRDRTDLQWQRPTQSVLPPAVRISRDAPLSAESHSETTNNYPEIQQVATNEVDELLKRTDDTAAQNDEAAGEADLSFVPSPIAAALAVPTPPMASAVHNGATGQTSIPQVDSVPLVDQAQLAAPAAINSPASELYAPAASAINPPAPVVSEADVANADAANAAAPTVADLVPRDLPVATPPSVVQGVPSNPVFFSMSDSSSEDNTSSPSDMFEPEAPAAVALPSTESGRAKSILVRPDSEEEPIVAVAEPLGLRPINRDSSESEAGNLRSLNRPRAMENSSPVVAAPVAAPSKSRKRFRPPVAVVAPPLAIERDVASNDEESVRSNLSAPVRSATQNPVAAAQPKAAAARKATQHRATKLHMTRAQVRSLTIGGHVRRINVTNENVCQAIATGPSQLKLIGTGNGVTRLVVWADVGSSSQTRVRTFEIHVEDAVEATGDSVGSKTDTLNRSIIGAFPNANVSVQQYQDRLIVSGDCETEETAKKIIRMVRKTCLIPVRDEIKVR